jgi:hypothetical protein
VHQSNEWILLLHEIGTIIAATAAAIAAVSSLRNGRTLKNGGSVSAEVVRKALHKGTKKKIKNDAGGESKLDWYKPPGL